MHVAVVTLFPAMITPFTEFGVVGRAVRQGLVRIDTVDPRSFATDPHGTVDDRPYGGGPGMVLRVEPFATAVAAARARLPAGSPVVFLSPQGRPVDQAMARRYAAGPGLLLVAGRYEGFDERLIEAVGDEEVSVGDFVLSGGEIAALAVLDATVRLQPGVLGDEQSAVQESFAGGLLDHPHYTRPEVAAGRTVPRVLLEGNHAAIRRWRRKQSLGRTSLRRPDLLRGHDLTDEDRRLLEEFMAEQQPPVF
ncbi:MAG: tRNA (guanosine(37)-N1)-methyltransferase TrmD [Gammaproteobacteria bacterium]|nr:tRNA (guanosine(37)-N1)-methyltransferase TrmD [Gammaproteobacteria bacterium]